MKAEIELLPITRTIYIRLAPESIGEEMLLRKFEGFDTSWELKEGKLQAQLFL